MPGIKLFLPALILLTSSLTVFSQTEDWKQYSSSLAGLAVKYPSDWQAAESAYERVWKVGFVSPGVKDYDVTMKSSIGICSQPKGHVSNSSDSRSRCSRRDDHLSESSKDKVVSEETLQINGLKIRRVVAEDRYSPTATYIYAFFSNKDRDFLVSSYFSRRFNLDRYIPVFDRMLATVRLLEEKTVLTYRNEKYDFALTYPVSWKSCPIDGNANQDEEEILNLVPEGKSCNGANYISVSRMTKFSYEKNNRDLKEFLAGRIFSKIVPYLEFGNVHAALGERADEKYIYRERYFYTNYPQTYELLKISEMCELNNEVCRNQAREILATAQRFLKNR